jgi:iron complex outermembrane receptor protein
VANWGDSLKATILTATKPFIGALALIIATPFNAMAQAGPEEIVVTARKREESLQDVPISITAFGADQIQSMGLTNNNDIATMTVNFNTMQQLGRRLDRPVIRGMAAPETFGEPNASYFIDGAYLSGSISAYTLGPIERVEILRGPQSAQFGRATFSGAVNYVTRKPANELEGEATIKLGEHDTKTYSGWVSGPLIKDKLLFFTSGSYSKYGGEWNNKLGFNEAENAGLVTGIGVTFPENSAPPRNIPLNNLSVIQGADYSDLGGTETKQVEGKLLWIIDDTSELSFKAGYVHGDDDHYPQLIVETNELNCYVPGEDLHDGDPNYTTSPGAYCGKIDADHRVNRLNLTDFKVGVTSSQAGLPEFILDLNDRTAEDFMSKIRDPGSERDQYNYMIRYTKDIGDWGLNTTATYNKSELVTAYDLDGTQARALSGQFHFYEEDERKDWSFETRVDSPGDKALRGSVGVYYYHQERESSNAATPGFTGMAELTDPIKPTTDNYALFGALDLDVTDQWSATAEARWARDVKEMESPNSCEPGDPRYDPAYEGSLEDKNAKNSLTPRFTVRYQATENAMIYIQAAKGNKPGDYNYGYYRQGRSACYAAEDPDGYTYAEEEKQWTYEIGTKTSWLNNRITANLAAFYIDWDNQAFFETIPIPGEIGPIQTAVAFNAGSSRIFGAELETTFAISDKLLATFAYGFTDGEFREGFSNNLDDVTGDGDLKGNTIPNSPRHNFVTSLAYTDMITADLGWFSRTDFSYEDGRYSAANNFAEMGKRQLWNARTGLETNRWTATLYVNNILDDDTPSAIIGFPRFNERSPANKDVSLQGYALSAVPGKTFGGEIVMRFGARAQ